MKPSVTKGVRSVGRKKGRGSAVEGIEKPEEPSDRDGEASPCEEFIDAESLLTGFSEADDVCNFGTGNVGAEGLK